MYEFGLTGGIGSGKSSVSQLLVARGAGLVDADATVKRLQRAGESVFDAIVAHFGDGVVGVDGELDRPAIAAIVFNDPEELKTLNEIVHPAVRDSMAEQRKVLGQKHQIVVLDIPLLFESKGAYDGLAGVVVVDVEVDLAVARLVEHRGFEAEDARARMANQLSRSDRLEKADFVIDNQGSLVALEAEVDRCWDWMQRRIDELASAAEEEEVEEEEEEGA